MSSPPSLTRRDATFGQQTRSFNHDTRTVKDMIDAYEKKHQLKRDTRRVQDIIRNGGKRRKSQKRRKQKKSRKSRKYRR